VWGVDGGQKFTQAGFKPIHNFRMLVEEIMRLLRVVLDVVECAGHGPPRHVCSALYNIKDDPQQEHNLYDQHPEVVDRLKAQMRDFLLSIDAPSEQLNRIGLK